MNFQHCRYVEDLPSHIKATTDYMRKMQDLNPLLATPVSMHIIPLYTNIPHEDGIETYKEE